MAKLYLVRHGKAAASWQDDPDPSLNGLGHEQAAAMADAMAPLGPLAMVTSPLRRTRETAAALESRWRVTAEVEPAVREIPSPGNELSDRSAWLQHVMTGSWADADDWLRPWRQGMIDRLMAIEVDTVVVSHFVAINVAVGHAENDDRVTVFRPDNCSITVLDNDNGGLRLVEQGAEAETLVR
ncbi:MAG: histidine phosphatase family protein [Alphaproteobacteria bacterium]|jgi:broad specificity phosphatase PhoE|nr:histidine phosphatase family protein [Alphaproteobacteria bacterium]MDP6566608.1 histidine phosphatase family protein [Alphaproteobacteria bacterium]MDP6815586.1 histidine phosphatase family protein [Alphaproteobacteria bacterium]